MGFKVEEKFRIMFGIKRTYTTKIDTNKQCQTY